MMTNTLPIPGRRSVWLCALMLTVLSCRGADMARPWTFWYWMYGAVSKPGIKADLQAMKDVVLRKRREEFLKDWVKEKLKTIYVRVNDRYKDCTFEYEGWIK